jgi:hypothetical protein
MPGTEWANIYLRMIQLEVPLATCICIGWLQQTVTEQRKASFSSLSPVEGVMQQVDMYENFTNYMNTFGHSTNGGHL